MVIEEIMANQKQKQCIFHRQEKQQLRSARGGGGPFESTSLDALISKRHIQGTTIKKVLGSLAETPTNTSGPVPCVGKACMQYAWSLTTPCQLH